MRPIMPLPIVALLHILAAADRVASLVAAVQARWRAWREAVTGWPEAVRRESARGRLLCGFCHDEPAMPRSVSSNGDPFCYDCAKLCPKCQEQPMAPCDAACDVCREEELRRAADPPAHDPGEPLHLVTNSILGPLAFCLAIDPDNITTDRATFTAAANHCPACYRALYPETVDA